MAFSMTVLADIRGAFEFEADDFETLVRNLKPESSAAKDFMNLAYSNIHNELEDHYGNEVDYFNEPSTADTAGGSDVFGALEPERLIKEVKDWNNMFKAELRGAVKGFDDMMKKIKDDHPEMADGLTPVAAIEYLADDHDEYRKYSADTVLFNLSNALRDMNQSPSMFCSNAMTMLPYDENIYSSMEYGTILSKEDMDMIIAHPENYAIIEVIYH